MYSKEFFDNVIEDKYIMSDNGHYVFCGDEWSRECMYFSRRTVLNSKLCSKKIISYLNKYLIEHKTFTCVQDYSRTQINGMCYNLQLINDIHKLNLSHSLCINLSVIAPFFHIHVLELKRKKDNFSKWNGFPERINLLENSTYKKDIADIKNFLTSKLCLNEFPDNLLDEIVTPDIFTEDIRKGEFTYFNAFFQREFDTR